MRRNQRLALRCTFFPAKSSGTVQRYFSTRSLRDARRSFWLNAFSNVTIHFALAFLGMGLFAYFATHTFPEASTATPWGLSSVPAFTLPPREGSLAKKSAWPNTRDADMPLVTGAAYLRTR